MERFVQLIVVGGLALVAGLWLAALFARGSTVWIAGVGLALLGAASVFAGIGSELEYGYGAFD
ncbi:hypothetical protein [Halopiger xanaduensis]|uniref:Uncharacterized protein n=1 Tax=Halopiger xanaduensis (strain DSM 18323 / JCM 14033 / SH-6) TaxID=797210 RepID=F8DAG4_HALXS|nr:hypothetical protein [Halopiger xanaduensis]AEH38179.1 hypothetical protein Halxa_3568 [Halopiger xanaduensis SH-6]